jgi:hypothetical protein
MLHVTKSGSSDNTFKTLESMLTQNDDGDNKPSIIQVADANLISVINKTLKWKQLYKGIKDEGIEEDIIESQQYELFDVLAISDFTRPSLTTLVIMCDASNSTLINKGKAERDEQFNNEMCDYMIREHRHRDLGLMFMFGVQKIPDLPTGIRVNSDSITILNGFSRAEITLIRHY